MGLHVEDDNCIHTASFFFDVLMPSGFIVAQHLIYAEIAMPHEYFTLEGLIGEAQFGESFPPWVLNFYCTFSYGAQGSGISETLSVYVRV